MSVEDEINYVCGSECVRGEIFRGSVVKDPEYYEYRKSLAIVEAYENKIRNKYISNASVEHQEAAAHYAEVGIDEKLLDLLKAAGFITCPIKELEAYLAYAKENGYEGEHQELAHMQIVELLNDHLTDG